LSGVKYQDTETYKKIITIQSIFRGYYKFVNAMKYHHLHDAIQIIRNICEKEVRTVNGLKVKY
jgi:hypothetical protein